MAAEDLDIIVRLRGARAAGSEAKALSAEIVGVGDASKVAAAGSTRFGKATSETEKRARASGRMFGGLRKGVGALGGSYFSAAKGILAAGAAFASYQGIKSSIDTTVALGKTTINLTKNLKLSTQAASEWAAVATVRGVDAKALNMSFGTLSKNIDAATKGWGKQSAALGALGTKQADQKKRLALIAKGAGTQADAFNALGVSQKTLASGNFNKILGAVSDGLNKMGGGAARTALSMRLFGRGWQTIVPVLRDGSKAMREQLQLADKYGVTFKGKTVKSIGDLIKAQREAKFATLGLQVAIGTELTPILTKAIGAFSKFVYQVRTGTGEGGKFRKKVEEIWQAAKPVVYWFGRAANNVFKFVSRHPGLVKVAAALFLASKALRLMRFGGAISGVGKLIGLMAQLVAAKTGSKVAGELGSALGAKPMGSIGLAAGRILGTTIGAVAGPLMVVALGQAASDWFKNTFGQPLPGVGVVSNPGGLNPSQWINPFHPNTSNQPPLQIGPHGVAVTPGFAPTRAPRHSRHPQAQNAPPSASTPHSGRKVAAGPVMAGGVTEVHNHFHGPQEVRVGDETIWKANDREHRKRQARR